MGGREVGGLANMLAAHMGFSADERDRVRRFWNAPNLVAGEGLKAVDMFEAVADGRIKALWIMGTNPAVSLPRADAMRAALSQLELLVVSDNVASNDTVARAHIALPAAAWGEKDGTVTNSERCISRQRAFLPPPGRATARLVDAEPGGAAPRATATPSPIAPPPTSSTSTRACRASRTAAAAPSTSRAAPASAARHSTRSRRSNGHCALAKRPTERLFGDGRFFTPDAQGPLRGHRRAAPCGVRLEGVAVRPQHRPRARPVAHHDAHGALAAPLQRTSPSRSRRSTPTTPRRVGLVQGALARVTTRCGAAIVRVLVNRGQQRGTLFVPIHWSAENSSCARIGALVQPATDPYSGQPESKATPARIAPLAVSHYGLALSRQPLSHAGLAYWTAAPATFGHILHFALDAPGGGWPDWQRAMLPEGDTLTFADAAAGSYRAAVLREGRLEAMILVGATPTLPAPEWLKSQFERPTIPARRAPRPAGRPAGRGRRRRRPDRVRLLPGRRHSHRGRRRRRAAARSRRSARASAPAPTAAAACPEIRRLIAASEPAPEPAAPIPEAAHEPA